MSSATVDTHQGHGSLIRDRLIVTATAVVWLVGTAIGSGWFGGGGVQSQGDGLFSDSATLIAPHGPAFAIWSVVYPGLAGYVVWQWLPGTAHSSWAGATRLPAAAAIVLNGVWLLVVFAGWILVSVLVMAGIIVALGLLLHRSADLPAAGLGPQVWVNATFGLYLGWICVASCANIALWLVDLGVSRDYGAATALTLLVLLVVVALAAFLITRTRQRTFRVALAAAITWGLAWVAVARQVGELTDGFVVVGATLAAVCVAALGVLSLVARTPTRARPSHRA